MPPAEEIIVPFRTAEHLLGIATHVRTTLLVSSLQSLRRRDRMDEYLEHLPAERHAAMQSMIAGQWVPMQLAVDHYQACQALRLTTAEMNLIGKEVGDRIEGTFLATMVRMAGRVGATPWTALLQSGRLYERIFRGGGGLSIVRVGPKEARAHLAGVPLAGITYFNVAMAGVFEVGAELFCSKAYAREVPGSRTPTRVALQIAWA
jgi:hypothetical protein